MALLRPLHLRRAGMGSAVLAGTIALGVLPLAAPPSVRARLGEPRLGEPQVRVLLQESPGLSLRGESSGLRLRDGRGRLVLELPAGQPLALRLAAGQVELQDPAPPLRTGELWIEPLPQAGGTPAIWLQDRRYRGRLQVLAGPSQLSVINHLGIETYLPSVVGSEMPASWPQAALRAQAVAARTYALRQRKPAASFDLRATVASQVYKGVEAETDSTWAAVRGTRALVLTFQQDLINAVFHSSSGGSTENSGELWSRQLPYLVSVPDFDQSSPVREWRKPLEPELLQRAFAEIGGVTRIEILASSSTGRVRQARVVGPRGQVQLTGVELRQRLALRSTLVRFETVAPANFSLPLTGSLSLAVPHQTPDHFLRGMAPLPELLPSLLPPPVTLVAVGRGFGHGVGMSQWGAYGMALRGEGYEQILQHFYRGARVGPFREFTAQVSPRGPGLVPPTVVAAKARP